MAESPIQQSGQARTRSTAEGLQESPGINFRSATRLNRSTLMMSIMFTVGLGWIFWEGSRQDVIAPPEDAEIEEAFVDSGLIAMKRQENESDTKTRSLIEAFYYEARQRQIPIEELAHNPFRYEIGFPVEQDAPVARSDAPRDQPPGISHLRLQSVFLHGGSNQAMISGYVVRVGTRINGWMVEEIDSQRVLLRWRDRTHELRIE